MITLEEKELNTIVGGISLGSKLFLVGGVISFFIGVFEGQIKLKWQKHKNTVFKGNFVEKPSIQIHQEDAIMYIKL